MDTRHPAFRWIERGEGEPLLLLHGLIGDMYHWEATLEGLATACRPMALTLPILDPRRGRGLHRGAGRARRPASSTPWTSAPWSAATRWAATWRSHLALTRPERVAGSS